MTTFSSSASLPRSRIGQQFEGNVFVLIEDIFAEHSNTTNKDIAMQYENINVMNAEYQNELDKWQKDGGDLSTAGKEAPTPGDKSISGAGIGMAVGGGAAGVIMAILVTLYIVIPSLTAGGAAIAWTGIGLILLAIAAVLVVVAIVCFAIYAIVRGFQCASNHSSYGGDDWGLSHTGLPTPNFDQNAYGAAQSQCQQDQTNVQQIQNSINQAFQQYVSPDQDMKTQDANMIQAALKWMASLVWTQSAA